MSSKAFETLVLNASPSICLGKAGLLQIIDALADRVVIPLPVATEILNSEEKDPANAAIRHGFGSRVPVESVAPSVAGWALGAGESSVLTLCLANTAWTAVLDDAQARRCAHSLRIRVIGTVGLIVHAYRQHLIPSVAIGIEHLERAGLYIDNRLREEVVRLAEHAG